MKRTSLFIPLLPIATLFNNTANAWTEDAHALATKFRAKNFVYKLDIDSLVNACVGVDKDEDTNPLTNFDDYAQMWHFNINECHGGTVGDSRFWVAAECLSLAIKDRDKAEYHLGRGLHAIQDVFSHTDRFVRKFKFEDGKPFYAHIEMKSYKQYYYVRDIDTDASKLADDPRYICEDGFMSPQSKIDNNVSQRYSDAITASLIYLQLYILLTSDKCEYLSNSILYKIEERLHGSIDGLYNREIIERGTFSIYCLTQVLRKIARNEIAYKDIQFLSNFFNPIESIFQNRQIRNIRFEYYPPYRYYPIVIKHNSNSAKVVGHIESTNIMSKSRDTIYYITNKVKNVFRSINPIKIST